MGRDVPGDPLDRGLKLRRAARSLGPRPADLGSNLAQTIDVEFVVGLTCDAPVDAPLVRGSLDALPFASGSLTGALIGGGPASDAAASELLRVLQPGGRVVVASDSTAWDEALRRAGFAAARDGGVVSATKPGGADVEIPRMGILSMFVPRRWAARRAPD